MIYIYNQIKDMPIELNTDINVLLKLFNSKFSNSDIHMNVKEIINDFLDFKFPLEINKTNI